MIAREVYRLRQEAERLEKAIEAASEEEREDLRDRLRRVRAERDRMRKVLEGNKEPPICRRPL